MLPVSNFNQGWSRSVQLGETVREGPLSICQESMLCMELASGVPFTITRVALIDGELNIPAFRSAAYHAVAAHESLRSIWSFDQGKPKTLVKSMANLPMPVKLV